MITKYVKIKQQTCTNSNDDGDNRIDTPVVVRCLQKAALLGASFILRIASQLRGSSRAQMLGVCNLHR